MLTYSNEDLEKIRHLIADGAHEKAMEVLYPIVEPDDDLQDTVVMLKTRLASLHKSVRNGTISREEENIERNLISHALLGTLNILEDLHERKKNTLTTAPPAKEAPPVETHPHPAADKKDKPKKLLIPSQWLARGALALATILVTVIIERILNRWLEAKQDKDLTVRLMFQPEYRGIRQSGMVKATIGKFATETKPIPPDGKLYFTGIPAEYADDSIKVSLEEVKYPCKLISQSAYSLKKSNDITAFIELKTNVYSGKALRPNLKPAAGVEIDLENGLARDTTDSDGSFTLRIPMSEASIVQLTARQGGRVVINRKIGLHADVLKEIKIPD